jgi:hypothetical protein
MRYFQTKRQIRTLRSFGSRQRGQKKPRDCPTGGVKIGYTMIRRHTVGKKKDLTEEEQFEAYIDSVDTSDIDGLIDPEDAPGSKKQKTHSRYFTDDEIAAMPSYTPEELAALPAPWTKRGEMISADKPVIQGLVDKNRVASRIFVTGEVAEGYIGDAAPS